MPRSIREVPMTVDAGLAGLLGDMRDAILEQQASIIPPRPVTNLKVTPGPGQNQIQFTRSDGERYVLYVNDSSSLNGSTRFDLGLANTFTHDIGRGNETRFYWVKAKLGQLESSLAGPVSGKTLDLAAPSVVPQDVPASENLTRSNETDNVVPGRPTAPLWQTDL